jgi:hypothetical protein
MRTIRIPRASGQPRRPWCLWLSLGLVGFSLSRAQFRVYGLGGWDCVRIHPLVKTNKSTYPSHNRGRVGVVERAFDGEFPSMLGDRNR